MRRSLLWVWIVLSCISSLELQRYSFEYCNMEVFNATCDEGHVIMVESARYGRMNIGRCMKSGYGHQGCSVDVLPFLDSKCSGRMNCVFQVPDITLYDMKPCPSDFTSYLEATHCCVPVMPADYSSCQSAGYYKVKDVQFGFITSQLSLATSRELFRSNPENCPWFIEVMRGQRINVTLHSILLYKYKYKVGTQAVHTRYNDNGEEACFEVGTVVDGNRDGHVASVCSGNERLVHVTLSNSHVVRVEFTNLNSLSDIGIFMFEFHASGCPYIPPTANSWHQQSGDTLVARCNNSVQSWHLICRGTEWIGEAGNCSNPNLSSEKFKSWSLEHIFNAEESFPFGVLLAVSIGVAMGIVIGASLLCLITFYLKRQRRNCPPLDGYNPPKSHVEGNSPQVQLSRMRECHFLPNHWMFHDARISTRPNLTSGPTKQVHASPNHGGGALVNLSDDLEVELFIGDHQPMNHHPMNHQPMNYHSMKQHPNHTTVGSPFFHPQSRDEDERTKSTQLHETPSST